MGGDHGNRSVLASSCGFNLFRDEVNISFISATVDRCQKNAGTPSNQSCFKMFTIFFKTSCLIGQEVLNY